MCCDIVGGMRIAIRLAEVRGVRAEVYMCCSVAQARPRIVLRWRCRLLCIPTFMQSIDIEISAPEIIIGVVPPFNVSKPVVHLIT